MKIVKTENLSAFFGQNVIVKKNNLEFDLNTLTAIIGPSGCGKSTLIRCLNRLHEEVPGARVEGKVYLDGTNIYEKGSDPVRIRQQVGMVFQKPSPFPTMSILDNTVAGLKLAGLRDVKKLKQIAEESLRDAALWDEVKDKLHAPGVSLSGGQQQRLCIARALAVKPRVLLLDEPTSALDPISTARVEELLMDLKKRISIIMVTHNMQQAARISDQTAFLLYGEVIEFKPTSDLFTNPTDQRTEQYVTGRFG